MPVNTGILRALLQCDTLLHTVFVYIREAMLRFFEIKMAKIGSESAFSVIKSLKYRRFCRFCVKFSRISLEVRDFFVPLPSRNNRERKAPRAVKDARVMTQGIFYAHTSETCQRSHYTNSGGHPVDISPWTEVSIVSRQGGLPLSLSIGENIPSRGTKYSQCGN